MKRKPRKLIQKRVRYDDSPPPEPPSLQETPLTMLELRQNSQEIMAGLESGVNYRLTYRGKTVGRIVPAADPSDEIPPDDAIFHMEDYISDGPTGALNNDDIDARIYRL